jgi:hypothetical protein
MGTDEMKLAIFAAAAMILTTGAMAAPPSDENGATAVSASPAEQQAAEADPADERKICRTEKATGSLTRRTRICMTAADWRELNDRTRQGVNEMNSAASGGKICVPNPADPFQGCS